MLSWRAGLLASVAVLAPIGAQAQDDIFELERIVVSANRVATDLARTGVSASVIDAETIERTGDTTVAAVLAELPGISISTQGGFGSVSAVRVRGADGRYLAVYVDGIRVSDPTSTSAAFDFGGLLVADVGRVEVLRGSQSALYGGSAVGGVINITTRRAEEDGTRQRIAAELGSYGTAGATYSFSRKDGPAEMTVALTHFRTDGFSAAAAGTEADGAEATRLSLGARYALSDALTLGGNLFVQRTVQEYDGFDPLTFVLVDQDNEQEREEAGFRLFAEYAAGATDHVFDLTYYRIEREFDQEGALSAFEGRRLGASWLATTELTERLTLVYGADAMVEEADYANLPAGTADSTIAGAFAQALWAPSDRLDLSATARVDRNSRFGSFPTGRLALAWRPAEATTLRAAIATGFRAPSIDERFGDYPGFFPFVGNPDLDPEESESYEIGVEHAFGNGATVTATLFRLDIDNLITFVPGAPSTLENLPGRSTRKGLELSGELPLSESVALTAAYTYTDATRPDGSRIGLVPRHDISLALDAELSDRLSGRISVRRAIDRLDDFGAAPLGDYTVVNAQAAYDLGGGTEVYLRIENLFDEDYELSSGYATAGQSVYAGLRKTF